MQYCFQINTVREIKSLPSSIRLSLSLWGKKNACLSHQRRGQPSGQHVLDRSPPNTLLCCANGRRSGHNDVVTEGRASIARRILIVRFVPSRRNREVVSVALEELAEISLSLLVRLSQLQATQPASRFSEPQALLRALPQLLGELC